MTRNDRSARLPERERNRLLRRVDWRFLLSSPAPDRLLCLGDEELRASCALIAGAVEARADTGAGEYDTVVASNPTPAILATVLARLRAGGELYAEWSGGMADAARGQVAAAGFADVRCYWPWPAPPNAEVWVPLDAPWAFDYYVSTDRHVYSGLRHRLGTRARRYLARRALATKRATPVSIIARKPAQAHAAAGGSAIVDAVRERTGSRGTTAVALLTGGPRAISKVIGLVYGEEQRVPAAIIKWPRVRDSVAGLSNESAVLAACHARAPSPGVPRVLATIGEDDTFAVAETAAAGAPMFATLTSHNVAVRARAGAAWISDFHLAHRGPPASDAYLTGRADAAIARFSETFGGVVDRALLDDTARILRGLRAVPVVIEHRDCGPWNIFLGDDGQLAVLDWESSRVEGLPLLDLIYFVTYMAFFVDGAMVSRRFADSYRASLDASTVTGALRHELVARYGAAFGISRDAERALRALCWMEHAESEFQHFTTDAAGSPSADALRQSVFAQLWAEEIIDLGR
ncbi:MAG TPA: phosphotransferase [Gemmatimonadaceae bacterium]|nr:phosphotransferase [Gemmatimonadaceae bacterium]